VSDPVLVVATVAALAAVVVWFDVRLLNDLAATPDGALRYFNRATWALLIIISFPIGPMLYLMAGKDRPRF
jgi:hypothetical protein